MHAHSTQICAFDNCADDRIRSVSERSANRYQLHGKFVRNGGGCGGSGGKHKRRFVRAHYGPRASSVASIGIGRQLHAFNCKRMRNKQRAQ